MTHTAKHPRAYHIATRPLLVLALGILTAGAARASAQATLAPVARPAVQEHAPRAGTSYIMSTPWFELTASSDSAMMLAGRTLRSTAQGFVQLFGREPDMLNIVVRDSAVHHATAQIETASKAYPSIAFDGAGLADGGALRNELAGNVAVFAATHWLDHYTADWDDIFTRQGLVFVNANDRPLERDGVLPEWLEVAVLHLMTDPAADDKSADFLRGNLVTTMPLTELFDHMVTPAEGAVLVQRLTGPLDESSQAVMDIRSDPSGFIAQSTSVLRYLTTAGGNATLSSILGAAVAGYNTREILARLPVPTTPERLDAEWREWVMETSPEPR